MSKYKVVIGFTTKLEFEVEASTQIDAIEQAYRDCSELDERRYSDALVRNIERVSTTVEKKA